MIEVHEESDTLTTTQILDAYRVMATMREFDERVGQLFALGELPGFVHLYVGQEAIAAGVCSLLNDDDYIASTHRGHGHIIAKGCDVAGMMAEVYGKSTGLCKGKGGSMHIADLEKGVLGANGIVGGGLPLTVGAGLSAKIRGTSQVSVGFLGDGAVNEGTFAESLNLAAVWDAPCVFVIENNGYAESTTAGFALADTEPYKRAEGYGIPSMKVDGNDFFAVRDAMAVAIDHARNGHGPYVVECTTSRWYGHYEGDGQAYRAPGEIENLRENHDPIKIFRGSVDLRDDLSDDDFARIDADVTALVDEAVQAARAASPPTAADLLTDVYAS